jgi:hypothetical protein
MLPANFENLEFSRVPFNFQYLGGLKLNVHIKHVYTDKKNYISKNESDKVHVHAS